MLAQKKPKHVTALIPLVDSTVHQFDNIYNFLPLYNSYKNTAKYVTKILATTNYAEQEKYLNKILYSRNQATLCLLAFDYYFKNKKPTAATTVTQWYNIIKAHNMYKKIDSVYEYKIPFTSQENFIDSVQKKIGWVFGYGAFYYTSPADSIYMAKMQKINPDFLDEKVEAIIEKYVAQQEPIFKYNKSNIVKEILEIPGVVNAIHDGCLTKTMQLPNWDKIHVVHVNGKDTLERVYTIELTTSAPFGYLRYLRLPIKIKSHDYVYYKKADYILHGYANTKKQCDINEEQHKKTMREYEEYLKNKQ
jgi:hypothetical protein